MEDTHTHNLLPEATPESKMYWDMAAKRELWLPRCVGTRRFFFPPQQTSPYTGGAIRWERVSGRAKLASYVIAQIPVPGFVAPYVVALVELEEGPRMTSNLIRIAADPSALHVGMPLQVCFEQRGTMMLPQFTSAEQNCSP